ncbi:hypothetical protein VNO80_10903 [Phaseolus coccineus]|uniref:Uncharacterized protein n=1 Tax=Phaseolus coccineus TaxID=3886 RepID=A0AAN9RDU9_PHACN
MRATATQVCLEEAEGLKLREHRHTERSFPKKISGSPINLFEDVKEKSVRSKEREASTLGRRGGAVLEEKEEDGTFVVEKSAGVVKKKVRDFFKERFSREGWQPDDFPDALADLYPNQKVLHPSVACIYRK